MASTNPDMTVIRLRPVNSNSWASSSTSSGSMCRVDGASSWLVGRESSAFVELAMIECLDGDCDGRIGFCVRLAPIFVLWMFCVEARPKRVRPVSMMRGLVWGARRSTLAGINNEF